MSSVKKRPILYYIHIPKTAGRSLDAIIRRQYYSGEYLGHLENHYLATQEVGKLSAERINQLKCIAGHFCFGLHKGLQNREYSYTTLLRDPIERVIDMYYFIQNRPNHHLKQYVGVSLEEFVYSDDYIANNLQTRYLLGTGEYFKLNPVKEDAERAKKIIEDHFTFVGVVDKFEESVFLMKQLFGWESIWNIKINVTPNRPSMEEIPEEIIEVVSEKNMIDLELYLYVKEKLTEKIKKLDPELRAGLDVYTRANQKLKFMVE